MGSWLRTLCPVGGACLLLLCGCAQQGKHVEPPGREREADPAAHVQAEGLTIELTGSGLGHPTVFTLEQLRGMPFARLENVVMRRKTATDQATSWRGPALELLLADARMKPGPMTITFEATDGYQMTCTREELQRAIVALQDGTGRWLADIDGAGTLRLILPDLTANYWVQDLCRITIEPSDGP